MLHIKIQFSSCVDVGNNFFLGLKKNEATATCQSVGKLSAQNQRHLIEIDDVDFELNIEFLSFSCAENWISFDNSVRE